MQASPVVTPTVAGEAETSLSFVNLVEAVALAGFREAGVSMQKVRRALEYASLSLGLTHLLANERLLTDGIDLFWEYQDRRPDEELHLVNMSRGGQKAFPPTVMQYLREMEWGEDRFASRWWPGAATAGEGVVVLDPRRAFGTPIIAATGVRTEDVFDRFSAGESLEELADDYGLTFGQIEAAIRTEVRIREPVAA
jgi:uncharacterized protein (DUF433 family)